MSEIGSCGDPAEKLLVALWRGTHSGNRQCVMAYGDANYYKRADRQCHEWIWPGTWGSTFCLASAGTDINSGVERRDAVSHLPMPVAGDARFGDCAHRIRLK